MFICYSSLDKGAVNDLVRSLESDNIPIWYDSYEIKLGESIIGKISQGIHESNYFLVIISKNSVGSKWANEELEIARTSEIESGSPFVIPIIIEACEIPMSLKYKRYCDLTRNYEKNLQELKLTLLNVGKIAKKYWEKCEMAKQLVSEFSECTYPMGYRPSSKGLVIFDPKSDSLDACFSWNRDVPYDELRLFISEYSSRFYEKLVPYVCPRCGSEVETYDFEAVCNNCRFVRFLGHDMSKWRYNSE